MPRLIGLNIVGNWLLAVEVRSGSGRPSVSAAFASKLPAELIPDNVPRLGSWLAGEFSRRGLAASEAVAILGRNLVSSKTVKVPVCPENELAALVAFAVEGEFQAPAGAGSGPSGGGGGGILDYQAGPEVDGEREILAAMVPATVVESVRGMLGAANIACKRIGPRAYATRYVWRPRNPPHEGESVLVVAVGADSLDLALWNGAYLLLSRSVPLSTGEEAGPRVALEARRTLAAAQSQSALPAEPRIAVCGAKSQSIAEAVAKALGKSVGQEVESFSLDTRIALPAIATDGLELSAEDLGQGGEFLAAVGAAWSVLDGHDWPIDFQNPKRPIKARDTTKGVLALAGVLAAVILFAGIWTIRGRFQDRDRRIKFHADELTRLNQELSAYQPILQRHRVIKQWADGEKDWLVELTELAARFPATDEAYLTGLEASAGQPAKPASFKLDGRAKDQALVTAAQRRWANEADRRYQVSPRGVDPVADGSDFAWRFGLELAVFPSLPSGGADRTETWRESVARLTPEGKSRIPATLAVARKPSGASAEASAPASTAAPAPKPSEPKKDSASSDPVKRLVDKIRALPIEEREKEIEKAPAYLRARLRKMIKEGTP